MNKQPMVAKLVLGILATSLLAGCELSEPKSNYTGAAPTVGDGCFSERYQQPDSEVTRSVDLLFVTDTSGSLDDERLAVANGIDSFVQELPSDVDVQIAVMLAHGSRSNHSGQLWKHADHPPVLSNKTMTMSKIREHLRYNLTNISNDMHGDGGEEGMYSFLRGMDHGPMTASRAKGFFRDDAGLAVVFIADENDICADYPAGVTPVRDPDGFEVTAKARDCGGVTPASVLSAVKNLQRGRPYLIGGILYNDHNTYPRVGENEYGYGYMELIQLASGITADMANGNISRGMADIGALTGTRLQLLRDFILANPGVDPDSIEVFVDGQPVAFTYDAAVNDVHVEEAGIAKSVVDINYCLMPESSDDGDPTGAEDGDGTGGVSGPTGTPSPSPTPTPTPTPDPTVTPSPTPSPTPDPTGTPSPSPTPCTGIGCGGGVIGV